MCAPITELPSNISTMEWGGKALSVIRTEKKNQWGCKSEGYPDKYSDQMNMNMLFYRFLIKIAEIRIIIGI